MCCHTQQRQPFSSTIMQAANTAVLGADEFLAFFERLLNLLEFQHSIRTVHEADAWMQMTTDWRAARCPLPICAPYSGSEKHGVIHDICQRVHNCVYYYALPFACADPFGAGAMLDGDDVEEFCCKLYESCFKEDARAVFPMLNTRAITALVRHVPSVMSIRHLFYGGSVMRLGAFLCAREAEVAAALRQTLFRDDDDDDEDDAEEEEEFVDVDFEKEDEESVDDLREKLEVVENTFDLLFDLREPDFFTELELCEPEAASTRIVQQHRRQAESWATRSVWVKACVEIGREATCLASGRKRNRFV